MYIQITNSGGAGIRYFDEQAVLEIPLEISTLREDPSYYLKRVVIHFGKKAESFDIPAKLIDEDRSSSGTGQVLDPGSRRTYRLQCDLPLAYADQTGIRALKAFSFVIKPEEGKDVEYVFSYKFPAIDYLGKAHEGHRKLQFKKRTLKNTESNGWAIGFILAIAVMTVMGRHWLNASQGMEGSGTFFSWMQYAAEGIVAAGMGFLGVSLAKVWKLASLSNWFNTKDIWFAPTLYIAPTTWHFIRNGKVAAGAIALCSLVAAGVYQYYPVALALPEVLEEEDIGVTLIHYDDEQWQAVDRSKCFFRDLSDYALGDTNGKEQYVPVRKFVLGGKRAMNENNFSGSGFSEFTRQLNGLLSNDISYVMYDYRSIENKVQPLDVRNGLRQLMPKLIWEGGRLVEDPNSINLMHTCAVPKTSLIQHYKEQIWTGTMRSWQHILEGKASVDRCGLEQEIDAVNQFLQLALQEPALFDEQDSVMVNLADSLHAAFFVRDKFGLESRARRLGRDGRKRYYQLEIRSYLFMASVLGLKGKADRSREALFSDVTDEDFPDLVFDAMAQVYRAKLNDKYLDQLLKLYAFCLNKSILTTDSRKKGLRMLGKLYFYDYHHARSRTSRAVFYEALKKIRNDETFLGYIGTPERDFLLGILEASLEMEAASADRFCEAVRYIAHRSEKNGRVQEPSFNFNEGARTAFSRVLNGHQLAYDSFSCIGGTIEYPVSFGPRVADHKNPVMDTLTEGASQQVQSYIKHAQY
jgi:hypothetical protein